MMYNNQYVMNNAALSNLLESPGHLKPLHEMPVLSEKGYEDLLQYTLECIRTHNSKQDKQIQVVGLSFLDTPLIGFDSRVWHVSKYNQAGLTDSLMTYLADEESDIIQLAELTVKKMDIDHKDMEGVKHTDWSCCLIDPILPDELVLVLKMSNGTELTIPLH